MPAEMEPRNADHRGTGGELLAQWSLSERGEAARASFSGWGSQTIAPDRPTAPLRCRCPQDLRPRHCPPCRRRPAPPWRLWGSPPFPSSACLLKTSGRWDPDFQTKHTADSQTCVMICSTWIWGKLCLPECYTVLIHGFLVIVDSHQEISQHSVQDTVALIGQGVAEKRNSLFIFLFPTFTNKTGHFDFYLRIWISSPSPKVFPS